MAWLAALLLSGVLAWPALAAADAPSVSRVEDRPFVLPLDCRAALPEDAQYVRIDPPAGGWPPWGQSVLVLDAPPGLVVIRRGDDVRCGLSFDARTSDARLRSGVGTQFSSREASDVPIEVLAPSNAWLGWAITIRHGDPAALQREDTLRFAIRVGGLAVLLAMLLAIGALFGNVRDRVALALFGTVAPLGLWLALRSGIAGWPQPWLPSQTWVETALVALPALGLASLWTVAIAHSRAVHVFPWLVRSHALVWAAALAFAATTFLWPDTREALYPALRLVALAVLGALLPLMVGALRRGHQGALAVLIAVAPPLLVLGPFYGSGLRDWRAEALLLSGAWFAIAMTIAMSQRVGALRRQRDRLRALSERDALTGLPNRRALDEVLPRRVDEAVAQAQPLSLVFVDLDRFKAVNDRHGHGVGDEVLQETARRLSDHLRGGELASRYGGEEFVLVLPGADRERASAAAERLRLALAGSPIDTSVGPIAVTASFGVADLPSGALAGAAACEALIDRADAAMYRAKQDGRNRVAAAD